MTLVSQATRLGRLAVALQLHDADVAPVLAVVAAAPPSAKILIGAATQGNRIELVMPFHPGALSTLGISTGTTSARGIRIAVEGNQVAVALLDDTPRSPREAADLAAPAAARERWFDLLDQFCAIANGRILGVTEWLDGRGTRIDVRYPERNVATDGMLLLGLEQLAGDLGVSPTQRRLFQKVHLTLGQQRELVVGTRCGDQVSPHLHLVYPVTDWDTAVRFGQGLVLSDSEAQRVPERLGSVAGALQSDRLDGLELILGPHEPPSVVVWARLAPDL